MLKIAGCPLPLLFPPRPLSCWALQIVRASYEVCNLAGWMDRPNTASALARCPDEMLVCPSYPSLERLCDELSKLNLQKGIHCHIPRCLVSSINAPRPRTSQGSMKFLLGQTRLLAQKTCCPPLHMSCTSLAIPPFPSGEWHAGRRDRVAAKPLPLCPPLSLPPSALRADGCQTERYSLRCAVSGSRCPSALGSLMSICLLLCFLAESLKSIMALLMIRFSVGVIQ